MNSLMADLHSDSDSDLKGPSGPLEAIHQEVVLRQFHHAHCCHCSKMPLRQGDLEVHRQALSEGSGLEALVEVCPEDRQNSWVLVRSHQGRRTPCSWKPNPGWNQMFESHSRVQASKHMVSHFSSTRSPDRNLPNRPKFAAPVEAWGLSTQQCARTGPLTKSSPEGEGSTV